MDPANSEMAALAADFRAADGSDRWYCWRGVNGTVYAWRLLSSPPAVLRDSTLDGLRRRMAVFSRVLAETRNLSEARAAADGLETGGTQ